MFSLMDALVRLWSWGPEVPKPIPAAQLTVMSDRFSTKCCHASPVFVSPRPETSAWTWTGKGTRISTCTTATPGASESAVCCLLCRGASSGMLKASAGLSCCRRNNQKWYFEGKSLKTVATDTLCADVS